MKDLLREMFYGFIAIAMFIELIGGDLYCLLFAIDRVALLLEITEELAVQHMLVLSVWNGMAAIGSAMVCYCLRNPQYVQTRRWGLVLTATGLVAYAAYQFWFAGNKLGDFGIWIQGISLIYGAFGLGTIWYGMELFRSDWEPKQPVQRERADDTLTMQSL